MKIHLFLVLLVLQSWGTIAQTKTVIRIAGTKSDSRIKDFAVLPNGDWLAIGQHFTYTDSLTIPNMAVLMDSTGHEKKRLVFGQDGINKKRFNSPRIDRRIKRIVQFPNGSIFLIGNHYQSYPTAIGLWIVQINAQLEVIQEQVLLDVRATNAYYLHAYRYQDDMVIVCQTSETDNTKNGHSYEKLFHEDIRVVRINQKLQIEQEWKHFAQSTKSKIEHLRLRDAQWIDDTFYIGVESHINDSVGSTASLNTPQGIKVFAVSMHNNAITTPWHLKDAHYLDSFAVHGDSVVCNFSIKAPDDSLYVPNSTLAAFTTDQQPIWSTTLESRCKSHDMQWNSNGIWMAGEVNTLTGSSRFLRLYQPNGQLIWSDQTLIAYDKESVGFTRLRDGRIATFNIDSGWVLEVLDYPLR